MTPETQFQNPSTPQLDPDLLNAAYSPSIRKTVRGGDRLQGVKPELLDHWNSLQDEFSRAGLTPEIKSGFRTAAQQNALFRNPATAAKTKGHDGYVSISPHQRGEALDISFPANQRAKGRSIIADYAKKNGLAIPSDEPWHLGLTPQIKPALDPDLLNAGYGQQPSAPATQNTPQLDPDLMKAAYGEEPQQPKIEKITSEVKPVEFQGETPQESAVLPTIKPIDFVAGNATPRKAGPTELLMQPFDEAPKGSAEEQLVEQRYKTPPSTELAQAVKIPFSPHVNPTEDDLVKGYLNALGPEYAKYGEKYKQETGRNILSLQAGDVDRDPDGSAYVKPTRAAVDVLNAYVKSGGDINAAKAEGARIAGERQGALAAAQQQAAPDIAEVEAGRTGLGTYSGTRRAVESPLIRYGAGKIQQLGGLVSGLGIAPNKLSDYLNTRGKVMELGSSLPPLTPQGEEIKRGVPEKVGTALGDLGLGVFDIIALKRVTGLSTGQVMALEAALKDNDKPLPQRGLEVAKAYTLGKILDGHLNRAMSSAMFAVPTGVESAQQVARGQMSKEDAILNTAIQGGVGAILAGGKPEGLTELGIGRAPTVPQEVAPRYELIGTPVTPTEREAIYAALENAQAGKLENSRFAIAKELQKQHGGSLSDWFGKMNTVEIESRGTNIVGREGANETQTQPNVAPLDTVRNPAESAEPVEPIRHVDLLPRRSRNTETGKAGQFKTETKAQREERLAQVNPSTLPELPELPESAPPDIREARQRLIPAERFKAATKVPPEPAIESPIQAAQPTKVETTAPTAEGGVSKPAPESVLTQSRNPSGNGQHEIARLVQGNPEWKARVLKELGDGAIALEANGEFASPADAAFRTVSGDIVTIRSAYGQDKPPTLGDKRDGVIIERKSAPKVEATGVQSSPEPSVASARSAQGKEPWQMTAQEFAVEDSRKPWESKFGVGGKNRYGESLDEYVRSLKPEEGFLSKETKHRNIVGQALAEGKPVPSEVLADYPDLATESDQQPKVEGLAKLGRETPKTVEPKIISQARERLEQGEQLKSEGIETRGSGGPDTQVLLDHLLVHGYDTYQSGKVKFEDWSAEMRSRFKDFKDEIEPHLRAIYERVVGRPSDEEQADVKPSTTGIAQRVEESRRSTLNKEPPQAGAGITAQDSVNRGRQLLSEGKSPEQAIEDFQRTGAISSDAMALVRAKHEELARTANQAFDEGRQNLNNPKFQAAEQARQEFWEKSVKPMQTEWAKTGMAQQGETDIDTGTFYGLYRAFKDLHNREPSPKEQGTLKDLSAKSAKANSDVQNVTSRLAAELDKAAGIQDLPPEIQQAVKRFVDQSAREGRRGGRQQTRKALDEEAATIKTNLAAAFQKAKSQAGIHPSGLARIDPEGEITKQLIAYAKNRAKAGITDAAQLIDDVHSVVKDFADVTKREVAEAILGGGLPKKERTESEWAKIKSGVRVEVKDYTTKESRDALGARLQGAKKVPPKDAAEVWKYARENYIDQGNNDFADVTQKVASDLGITPDQVRRSLANTAATKRASDEMWKKMADRRQAKQNAESWVRQADSNLAYKAFENARRLFFLKATAGHGFVAPFTHAPANVFIPSRWAQFWPNFGRTYQFLFNKGVHEQAMTDLEHSPNYVTAKRAGLANDPRRGYDEYQSPWMAKTLGKFGISGNRAFDSLKTMRQDLFDSAWRRMPEADRTSDMAKVISEEINSSTGASKALTGKDWPSRFLGKAMFAAPLEASRWEFLVRDNARALQSFTNWKNATPEARYMAKRVAARNAQLVATYGALLAMNQGLLTASGSKDKVNFTDPTKADFLAFKIAGHSVSPASGMLTALRFIGTLASQAKNADLKKPAQTVEDMAKTTFKYGRSKLSPLFSTGADVALRSDYGGRPLPFSRQEGTEERPRYSWLEYLLSQQTPIPIGEGVRDVYNTMREQGMAEGQTKSLLKALANAVPVAAIAATGIRVGKSYLPSVAQVQRERKLSFQDRFMQGKITENDLDRAAKNSELTQSDINSILKEKDIRDQYNPSQAAFYKSATLTPNKTSTSLDRYERMTQRMRAEVKDIMQDKADAILDSDSLTELQKKDFAKRIKDVGLAVRGWKEEQ